MVALYAELVSLTVCQIRMTHIQPMLMTATTAIFVERFICRFHTMAVGIGMMMRSMNIDIAQLDMMNWRLLMHFPPLTIFPSESTWSIAGRKYAYLTGSHWKMLTMVVETI